MKPWKQHTSVPGKVFLGTVLVFGVVAALAATWKLAVVGVVAFAWFLFAVVRVEIDDEACRIRFGLLERCVSLGSIRSVVVTKMSIVGGFGFTWLRRSSRGTEFSVPGSGGGGVLIEFEDDRGRVRSYVVASRAPVQLRDELTRRLHAIPSLPGADPDPDPRLQQADDSESNDGPT